MPTADSGFFSKCLPRVVSGIERCGGATVCDIGQVTAGDFDSIYLDGTGHYRVDHAITEADFVGSACNAKQNGFYQFLAATRKTMDMGAIGKRTKRNGTVEVEPFLKMARTDPINNNYWQAKWISGTGTTGPYVYQMTSATGIPADAGFFSPELRFHLSGVKTNGTRTFTQWKVVSAAVVNLGGTPPKYAINVTATPWQGGSVAPAASKEFPGTTGNSPNAVALRGTPNVNRYEEYCPVLPALNSDREAYFWIESNRYAMCESSLTKEYMQAIFDGNPYYKKFFHVDDVQYNKQVTEDWQNRFVHQFFFGKASDANQTATDWDNLPTISLDAEGLNLPWQGKCIGHRADSVGVLEQAYECGRVWDLQGEVLPLGELFKHLYQIQRIRESLGMDTSVIEIGVSSDFAIHIQTAMLRYFNARSEGLLRVNMELSSKPLQNVFGFRWREYELDFPAGLRLRVVTHPAFDDWSDAHRYTYTDTVTGATNMSNGSGMILILDWAHVYDAIFSSSSVTNKTGTLQELASINAGFACRMAVPSQSYKLTEVIHATVMECAKSNLIILGFDGCKPPDHTAAACGLAYMPEFDPNPGS